VCDYAFLCEGQLYFPLDGKGKLGNIVSDRNDDCAGRFHGLGDGGPLLFKERPVHPL
jgi:hypothetical protein